MGSLKDIKRHIGAVSQTKKLTQAMNMVAASKLRTVQGRTERFRVYSKKHAELVANLATAASVEGIPLLNKPVADKKIAVFAFSSDRGLCGSFNANTIDLLNKNLLDFRDQGHEFSLTLIGRKINDFYKKRAVNIEEAFTGVMNDLDYLLAQSLTNKMIEGFLSGKYHRVYVLYTHFQNMMTQRPTLIQLLPLDPTQVEGLNAETEQLTEYIVEPDAKTLLADLLPRSLTIFVFQAMLETLTSINAARMQAMDNASRNCTEMIDSLSLAYNKARQAAVTSELLDIVGGVEALSASS